MFLELYAVRGRSMAPSLLPGDRLVALGGARRLRGLSRGDVVVARVPGSAGKRYLKRVVGLPGEEVRTCEGWVWIDGEHLDEPYLAGLPASVGLDDRAWRLAGDEYFVMGDNRAHSTDSRELGPVAADAIVSVAWLRWWPPGRWGRIKR